MKQLWTEKHRPNDIDGYVFRDQAQKEQVATWIKEKTIPHLLFSGAPGVGKTTLAKILITQLGIDEYDVLEINASRENSVDTIRDKISGFVETMPFGDFKIVLLDEACWDAVGEFERLGAMPLANSDAPWPRIKEALDRLADSLSQTRRMGAHESVLHKHSGRSSRDKDQRSVAIASTSKRLP